MFETIRSYSRVLMYILVPLIIGSFVFVGVDSYFNLRETGNEAVARVDGQDIRQSEWDASFRESVEQFRRQAPGLDLRMFETPEMKRQALDELVRERVMRVAANKNGFLTTDDRLLNFYRNDPQFAPFRGPDGNIDRARLEMALAAQGMTVQGLEARMRDMLALRQVSQGITGTVIAPPAVAGTALDAMYQQREAQIERFDATAYAAKVNPSDAEIEAYYKDPANQAQFQSTEQADIEYVVLDLEAVKKGITVTEEALKSYYTQNEQRFTTPEERRARHILIKAGTGASDAERSAAKAKAEGLQASLAANPSTFADVARKESQDPGTAERGGDVDTFIARGDTDKAYETALFGLKPDEVSGVVPTSEGFYIIQLQAVRGGEKRSFEAVRAELENEVRTQQAQARYAEAANEFTNTVYEQSDSLKPIAEKLKLEIRTAKAVTRAPQQGAEGPLASPKLLEAIFSSDALRNKRNTEAVETQSNQLTAARVTEYRPAALRPLAEVRDLVKQRLVASQAAALARKEGEARLAAAKAAPATAFAQPAVTLSRAKADEVPREIVDAVLKAPATALPAVVGVDLQDRGFAVVRVTKVLGRDPVAADPKQAGAQYAQAWAAAESEAYYQSLKTRYKAKVLVGDAPAQNSSEVGVAK
jgi:peptidyl-prolyl cis-trans isomerase D